MVSLKVLQLELSPPHTPHLSSCFEEPTVPSHPTLCSLGHRNINKKCSASEHIHLSRSHTLTSHSPRTHTLCGSLYEQRVPSRTILCMKTTSRVSLDWQCRWQRLLAGKQTEKHTWKRIVSLLMVTFYILNELSTSQHYAASHRVCLCESYYNNMETKTWQFTPVRMNTPTSSRLSQINLIQKTLSCGAFTPTNKWLNRCNVNPTFPSGAEDDRSLS